jgi:hypothetical protein
MAISCEELEKSLFTAMHCLPKCLHNHVDFYPPLPASPAEHEALETLTPKMKIYSTRQFMDDSVWMFNLFEMYTCSTDIRRANDVRAAFEMGSFKSATVEQIIDRVQMIRAANNFKESYDWILPHLEGLVEVGFLTL